MCVPDTANIQNSFHKLCLTVSCKKNYNDNDLYAQSRKSAVARGKLYLNVDGWITGGK